MRTFVSILLAGTPAAVNQLVITQLYNPEGTADTLSSFLALQCKGFHPQGYLFTHVLTALFRCSHAYLVDVSIGWGGVSVGDQLMII